MTIGFVLALLGGLLITYEPSAFRVLLREVLPHVYQAWDHGIAAAFQVIPEAAIERARVWIEANGDIVQWSPQVAGALLILLAGWCLKKRMALFLVGAGVVGIALGAMSGAYNWYMPLECIAVPAVVLAYCIQAGTRPTDITARGLIGFAIVSIAMVGLILGYFFLPTYAPENAAMADVIAKEGPAYLWMKPAVAAPVWMLSTTFVDQWSDVVLWGVVLLLTAIGAVVCRDRLLRLLAACLTAAMAVILFRSAYIEWIFFPSLGADVPPLKSENISNLELWQWLALAEMVLVAAVLLYKSLGAGGLTVVVALLWMCCGMHVDNAAGRINMARYFSTWTSEGMSNMPPPDTASTSVLGSDMGLPIGRPPVARPRPVTISEREKAAQAQRMAVGVATPTLWVYLTAALAGVILVAGLRMLVGSDHGRWWLNALLWVVLGLVLTCVLLRWPSAKTTSLQGWGAALATHPIHREVILLVAAASAAFFGMWALRWNSRYHTWLYAAATSVFLGTILSFLALAVMIRWGGFDPLPVQTYIVLAVGQSALMWVLMLHANFAKPHPARVA